MTGIKYLGVLFFILFFLGNIFSQAYGTAIGLRAADGIGGTLQQQVALHTTIEGIVHSSGANKNDVTLCILGEQHHSILFKGFNFYTGGGLYYSWLKQDANLIKQPSNPFGLTGIAGLEMRLGKIVLSTDIKPNLKLAGEGNTIEWHSGISIRYIIADRFFRNDGWMFWKKKKKNNF